jgi:hypothetical protein
MRIGALVFVALGMVLVTASGAPAISVTLPVDPALIGSPGPPFNGPGSNPLHFAFGGLEGVQLSGQIISVDFEFANDLFVWVTNSTLSGAINPILIVNTNAPFACFNIPGFNSPTCGNFAAVPLFAGAPQSQFLISPNGDPIKSVTTSSLVSSGGDVRTGFVTPASPNGEFFDFIGLHMALQLPSTGDDVTGAELFIFRSTNTEANTFQFSTVPIPEPCTGVLLGVALVVLVTGYRRIRPDLV